jgi:hypothetical protein
LHHQTSRGQIRIIPYVGCKELHTLLFHLFNVITCLLPIQVPLLNDTIRFVQ